MELFSIVCTTCQAKLRVRDASAIGQIVTCPKCGSMVLIEAPSPAIESPAPALVSSQPATPPVRQEPPTFQHSMFESGGQQATDANLADTADDPTRYGTIVAQEPPGEIAPRIEDVPVTSIAEPPPLEARSIDRSTQRRFILASLAGATGVVLAIVVLALVAARQVGNSARITKNDEASNESAANSLLPEDPIEAPVTDKESGTESSNVETAAIDPLPGEPPTGSEGSTAGAPIESSIPDTQPPAEVESNTKEPDSEPNAPSTIAATEPATVPPDFASAGKDQANADRMTSSGSLAETLRKLGVLFDEPPSESPTVEPQGTGEQPPPGDEGTIPAEAPEAAEPDVSPRDESIPIQRPPQRTVDVAARLSDPIAEIQFKATPLVHFIDFISSLSTIPITLRVEDLMWLDVTPMSAVSVSLKDTTTAKVLDAGLSQIGLGYEVLDGQIVVKRRTTAAGNRKVKLNVSDLVEGENERISELQEHMVRLVSPESWQGEHAGSITPEGGSLVVENSEEVILEIIAICERLRVARGLPTRGKYNPKYFQTTTRSQRAQSALGRVVKLTYVRPTPLVKILDRISREVSVNVVVDWQAIAPLGWNPDAELTFSASNLTLHDALEKLLKPMDLTYRIVDETTFQITSPAALEATLEFEIYPITKQADETAAAETEIKRIVGAFPAEWFRESGGTGALRYDSASRSLLVVLPQQRQQAIEKLIAASAKE